MILLSENSSRLTLFIVTAIAILAIYPVALGIVAAVEWLAGSGSFVDEMIYGSKRRLIKQIAFDWLGSAYWWLPISCLVLLTGRFIKSPLFSYMIMVLGVIVLVIGLFNATLPMLFAATLGMALFLPALVTTR